MVTSLDAPARVLARAISLLILGVWTPTLAAQPPTPDAVRAWLEAEVKRAAEPYDFGNFSLAWRAENYNTRTAAEIAALRAEVVGKPEHPGHHDLQVIDHQLAKGSFNINYRLFAGGTAGLRFCRDDTLDPSGYADAVWAPGAVWRLSERSLSLMSASKATPETFRRRAVGALAQVRDPGVLLDQNVFRPMADRLLFGGLDPVVSGELKIASVTISGDRWTAGFKQPGSTSDRAQTTYSGRWDASMMRGFIEERRSSSVSSSTRGETVERYLEWSSNNALGRPIARRVELFNPDGRHWRSLIFVAFDPLPEGGFVSIIEPPTIDRPDPLRGSIAKHAIADFVSGTKSVLEPTGDRITHQLNLPNAPTQGTSPLRTVGWILAALLVIGVVVLRVQRRS